MKKLFYFLLILSGVLILLSCSSEVDTGDIAPSFTLNDPKGKEFSLDDYLKEKVVILYFGDVNETISRQDCRELQQYYHGNEHRVQIAAIMYNADSQEIGRFTRKNSVTFPVLIGEEELLSIYGVTQFPEAFIIDSNGMIAYKRIDTQVSMENVLQNITGLREQEIVTPSGERPDADIRLEYWRVWEGPEIFEPIIKAYEDIHSDPQVDIVYKQIGKKTYMDNLLPSLKIGKGPDMCEIHASWLPHYIDELAPIPSAIMSPEEYRNTFHGFVSDAFTADDRQWAIALGANTLALFYHRDVFLEAELDPNAPPRNWDELEDYALTIKQKTGKWGVALGSAGNVSQDHNILEMFAVQNDARPISDDNRRALVNNQNFIEAMDFYTGFIKRYNVWSESAPNEREAFMNGELGMLICGSWYIKPFQNAGINFAVTPVPQKDPEDPYTHATFWGEVVSKDCENPEIAWDFLVFCAKKENMLRFFRATLRPPTRKDLLEIAIQEEPVIKPFMEQTSYAGMWFKPWEDKWKEIQLEAINAVLHNVTNSQQALQRAAVKHNETLASYNKPYDFSR